MNREAMQRILRRPQIDWKVVAELADQVAMANPPKATPRPDPAPWELVTHPEDPRERLTRYLDAWVGMDEATWQEANVKALYEDIMDVFKAHPEAEAWFKEWRTAHPAARLA